MAREPRFRTRRNDARHGCERSREELLDGTTDVTDSDAVTKWGAGVGWRKGATGQFIAWD